MTTTRTATGRMRTTRTEDYTWDDEALAGEQFADVPRD